MNPETHNDLKILTNLVQTLPGTIQAVLQGALIQLNSTLLYRRKILKQVQDTLDQIRLDMNYLIFDLEATRRERDEYKQLLENR